MIALLLLAAIHPQVMIFVRTDCPISNSYAPEVKRLHEAYKGKGIDFQLIYSEPGLTEAGMRKHISDYGYLMPSERDEKHRFSKPAGATVTPEAVVFVNGKVVYKGRIDDRFEALGKSRRAAAKHDLEEVLNMIVEGKQIRSRVTKAVGCAIEPFQ